MHTRSPLRPFAPLFAVALVLAPPLVGAQPAGTPVDVDPSHTSAAFTVAHFSIAKVSGQVPLREAKLSVDAAELPTSAEATFDLSKITTQNDRRDADLRSEHWFDTTKYPTMTFISTSIERGSTAGTFTLNGTLEMHGITHPITLAGTYGGSTKDGKGRTHLGYGATGTIDRTQWSVGKYPAAIVGNTVSLTIQLEAIKT